VRVTGFAFEPSLPLAAMSSMKVGANANIMRLHRQTSSNFGE
jgi:hypothetical protein